MDSTKNNQMNTKKKQNVENGKFIEINEFVQFRCHIYYGDGRHITLFNESIVTIE